MQTWVKPCVAGVVGVVLVTVGVLCQVMVQRVFTTLLERKLVLAPDSPTLESFKAPPVTVLMEFYFFNVTNSAAVVEEGAAPRVSQVGPYTFEKRTLKYDLEFNASESSVTYLQNKTFIYRPDLTPGSLSDRVTTVNALMMSLAARSAAQSPSMKLVVHMWFRRFSTSPFVTHPVGELLFEGYEEPLLLALAPLTNNPVHRTGRFGFFYPKNNTNDGAFTIHTGAGDMSQYQSILRWRGSERVSFWGRDPWGGDTCNMINGTPGTQFPRPVSKTRPLRLYTAELCRSIYAEYEREEWLGPLRLYRYTLPPRLMAKTPENSCYCSDDFTCRASMINVAPCRDGAPIIMSMPHFYQGAAEDVAQVGGLAPDAALHETFLDIEPNTGVTFRAAKRIQVNIPLRRYGGLPGLRQLPDVILPVLWAAETAEVPVERAEALNRSLSLPFTLATVATVVLVVLGLVLVGVAVLLVRRRRQPPPSRTPPKDKDPTVTEKLANRNYS